jgi:hypothetical protein
MKAERCGLGDSNRFHFLTVQLDYGVGRKNGHVAEGGC